MSVHARVRLTIEIDVGSTWGEECQLKQINSQAAEEALKSLNGMRNLNVIGKPVVETIIIRGVG